MVVFLILKLLVVGAFLVMFLRRPSLGWGIGLLTVTTAVLLDTFLGAFNREEMLAQLGFFFYVLAGLLVGGAAYWLLTVVLRPSLPTAAPTTAGTAPHPHTPAPPNGQPMTFDPATDESGAAFDRQMIYEEIRDRLSRDDILDLMFDLGIKENEVMTVQQDLHRLIINIMERTAERDQTGALALAVERILTPPAPDMLPRLEKISVDSPPTILRHYLLANYDLERLQKMAVALGVDWEQLTVTHKKSRVRDLLLYLYRRNRIDELVDLMKTQAAVSDAGETQ